MVDKDRTVSVILPTRNVEAHIGELLHDIFNHYYGLMNESQKSKNLFSTEEEIWIGLLTNKITFSVPIVTLFSSETKLL